MAFTYSGGVITQANAATKSITAVADAGSGNLTISVTAHGYVAGNLITIAGTTDYNSDYLVISVNTNDFLISGTDIDLVAHPFTSSQTGTSALGDSNFSGITGLSGVTTSANGAAENARNVYSISSADQIVITGHCTLSPENEELILGKTGGKLIKINSGGVLRIGLPIKLNGITRYPYGTAIHAITQGDWADYSVIQTLSGATLKWYGGIIFSGGGSLEYAASSTVRLYSKQCVFLRTKLAGHSRGQIRMSTDDYIQNGFTDIGYSDVNDYFTFIGFWNTFSGYTPIHKIAALAPSSSSSASTYLISNYDSSFGNTNDAVFWSSINAEFRNSVNGSQLAIVGLNASSASNRGRFDITEDLVITAKNTSNVGIASVKYYFTDYDNGDRKSPYTSTIVYSATADGSGVFASKNILVMCAHRTSGSPQGTSDVGDNKFDYRSRDNSNTDVFVVNFISYGYLLQNVPIIMKGANGVNYTSIFISDSLITQATKATVDAYATIDDAYKIYDRAKSYLYDNFLGETSVIVSRAGAQISLAAKNLIIDATVASAFAYSSPNLTVKSSTFTGGATATTGNVTVKNGALLNGGSAGSTFDCNIYYQGGAGTTITSATCSAILDFNTAGTYTLDGCTINAVTNSSGGSIILLCTNGTVVTTNTGPNITIKYVRTLSITGIVSGSRLQIYNVTAAAEVYNAIVGATSYSTTYTEGLEFTSGDTVRIRLTYQNGTTAYQQFTTSALANSSGWSAIAAQEALPAYTTIGIDGSTVTEYTLDVGNIQVDSNDADGVSQKRRMVAWFYYAVTTSSGIANFFRAIVLEDAANAYIDPSVVNLKVDNVSTRQLHLDDDDFRLYCLDGSDWVLYPSTGGYGISYGSGKVYVAGVAAADIRSAVGLASANLDTQLDTLPTASEIRTEIDANSTKLTAVKAKTDSLAFTVAGQVDANVQYVNDTQVTGNGAYGSEWGPA